MREGKRIKARELLREWVSPCSAQREFLQSFRYLMAHLLVEGGAEKSKGAV